MLFSDMDNYPLGLRDGVQVDARLGLADTRQEVYPV